jgi:uncharacterized membrane protein AbrB (regulator of aidB expression)
MVAALAALIVGFIYYLPPVFGLRWGNQVKRYTGLADADLTPTKPSAILRIMGLWLLTFLANGFVLAWLIRATGTLNVWDSILLAVIVGAGFGLTISSWPVIHARQPPALWLINAVSYLIAQVVMATILTMWK